MEEKELDILQIVADNPKISQRKIAEQTGVSLGQVNFLLKKFVKKGLLKIEGQSTKSLQYNLTPKGIKEKAEKTLSYIKISYSAVLKIALTIRDFSKKAYSEGKTIYIYGEKDEMYDLVTTVLDENKIKYVDMNNSLEFEKINYVILYWDVTVEKNLEEWENKKLIV